MNDLRKWMRLAEGLEPAGRIESPQQMELDLEDIDYEHHWREILEYPDPNAAVSQAEQVQRALQASGARRISIGEIGEIVYITRNEIITGDGDYDQITAKTEWLGEIDPETYFPEFTERWNREFWQSPPELYHATTKENVKSIQRHGLQTENRTRGISNRSVGAAIFTTSNLEETVDGSYGESVFAINTAELANSPDRPYASQEPDVVECELRNALAHAIGCTQYEADIEGGMSADTVILQGGYIAPQYLTLVE